VGLEGEGEKKYFNTCLGIKKKVYFCRLFEVECKREWEVVFESRNYLISRTVMKIG